MMSFHCAAQLNEVWRMLVRFDKWRLRGRRGDEHEGVTETFDGKNNDIDEFRAASVWCSLLLLWRYFRLPFTGTYSRGVSMSRGQNLHILADIWAQLDYTKMCRSRVKLLTEAHFKKLSRRLQWFITTRPNLATLRTNISDLLKKTSVYWIYSWSQKDIQLLCLTSSRSDLRWFRQMMWL